MKILIPLVCIFCCFTMASAQEIFAFTSHKKKAVIPFKLVSNLIIMPIKVNGVEMNFLLDTGVEETILFSLDENDEVKLFDVEKIKLRGLGSQDAIEGLKSKGNVLSVRGLESSNQEILIVLDETFNLSSSLGVPVNGIIGYRFFKNNLVQIDYGRKKIVVYNPLKANKAKITKGYTPYDISIEKNKPYVGSQIAMEDNPAPAKLLLDTGNSDAIWLFHNNTNNINVPAKNFEDFLGRGFSGEIYGKKARIGSFSLEKFKFDKPIAAFPDTLSIKNVKMAGNRSGSVGGEIFKRFSVIFDYTDNKLYLRKNDNFDLPFHYNMSGIVLHHTGLKWVQGGKIDDNPTANTIKIDLGPNEMDVKYKFELKPVYEIVAVRKGSPAEKAGLKKGDIVVTINGSESYKYSLDQINEMLKSEEGRTMEIQVERNKAFFKYKFKLEAIL